MAGVPEDQIIATRDKAIEYLESMGYEVFTDEWYSKKKHGRARSY